MELYGHTRFSVLDLAPVAVGGTIASVRRDRNADQKPDAWEEYRDNQLVNVKYDEDFDGKVDRTDDNPDSTSPAPTPPPTDPTTAPPPPPPAAPAGSEPKKT